MSVISYLGQFFEVKKKGGWTALEAPGDLEVRGYRTKRIAKLVAEDEIQFTIGATKMGMDHGLNETIRSIIVAEGIELLERFTTDGTSQPKKQYPAFSVSRVTFVSRERVIYRIQGAILQVSNEEHIQAK